MISLAALSVVAVCSLSPHGTFAFDGVTVLDNEVYMTSLIYRPEKEDFEPPYAMIAVAIETDCEAALLAHEAICGVLGRLQEDTLERNQRLDCRQ